MNIAQIALQATTLLKKASVETALLDARLLLSHALDKPLEYLLLNSDEVIDDNLQEKFQELLNQRCMHKPLAYILGYKEFYGRNFKLNDNVLIPRPDTETLVDAVLAELTMPNPYILELGCGSGCIIISLQLEIPHAQGMACDISNDALSITGENSKLHNVDHRLEIINSNWFDNIKDQQFDVIVSNPPYIADHEKSLMSRETLLYEPRLALFAEDAGLAAYRLIASKARKFMKSDGVLILEIGFNQFKAVKQIFESYGFALKGSYKDINDHNRAIAFTLCD